MPISPALGRWRQDLQKFKVTPSLFIGHTGQPGLCKIPSFLKKQANKQKNEKGEGRKENTVKKKEKKEGTPWISVHCHSAILPVAGISTVCLEAATPRVWVRIQAGGTCSFHNSQDIKETRRSQGPNNSFKGTPPIMYLPSSRCHLLKVPLPPRSAVDWD